MKNVFIAGWSLVGLLSLSACSDPIEKCVAQKQEQFRGSHPKADYATSSTANEKFRHECERDFKTKK